MKLRQGKFEIANQRLEAAGLDPGDVLVVGGAVDGPELHDVPGLEEDHEVTEIADLLLRIEDGHGGDPEHLVPAGAAHRIDAGEASAVADGQLRSIGTRPQILRHLDLPLAIDHLEHEGQAGHEADHGHEPRGAGVRPDERLDRIEAVDPRRVLQVGAVRVLVALAKAHQRLVRPGVVVEDRDLDDPRLQDGFRIAGRGFEALELRQQIGRADAIRIELDLAGGVGRTDLGHPLDPAFADRVGDGQALEERFERHLFADLDEDVVVPAKRVSCRHAWSPPGITPGSAHSARATVREIPCGRWRCARPGRPPAPDAGASSSSPPKARIPPAPVPGAVARSRATRPRQ